MAPQRVEDLLPLALETPGDKRPPPDFSRVEGAHPTHGLREPLLASATDPSGAGEAGIQGLRSHGGEVYAPASAGKESPRLSRRGVPVTNDLVDLSGLSLRPALVEHQAGLSLRRRGSLDEPSNSDEDPGRRGCSSDMGQISSMRGSTGNRAPQEALV
jgi:hypothetical protein